MSANINISNYESYLLSFVDGELNTEEIAELELFMQKNPGIREELALLSAVKIQPDKALVFDNKANLYRGASALSLDNYEEYLLSYVDNELTATEVSAVERFLGQHPEKRQELAWLQATRQQPDLSLQFENKVVLYRHTAKTRKIQPGIWWGAAAAVLAGLVIWLLPFNKETAQPPVIANTTPTTPSVVQSLPAPALVVTPQESKALDVTAPPVIAQTTPAPVKKEGASNKVTVKKAAAKPVTTPVVTAPDVAANNTTVPAATPEKQDAAPVLAQLAPPRNTSKEVIENRLEENKTKNITVTNTVKDPVLATSTHIERTEKLEQPAAAPAQVRGELIASVSGSDSKLLDKVTNVAKFFSKRKR